MHDDTSTAGHAIVAAGILGVLTQGCAAPPRITDESESYRQAVTATDPASAATLAPGSDAERAAIGRVQALFETYTPENVQDLGPQVYAEDAYLRDGFKELHGGEAIVEYLVESAESVGECRFEFRDAVSQDGNVYLRWVMQLRMPKDPPDRLDEAIGMSHFRFNEEGKVIFHQDYWDPTDVLYSRIPVANWLIKKVKARL